MKLPAQLGLPALTFGLLVTASTVFAQSVHFNRVDTNRDGVLSGGELEDALGSEELSAMLLLNLDQNGDTMVSRDEVRAAADQNDDQDEDEAEGEEEGEEGEGKVDQGSQGGNFDRREDGNHGHGNDEDGFDDDNPGRGHGNDGTRGGGRSGDNPGRGHDKND